MHNKFICPLNPINRHNVATCGLSASLGSKNVIIPRISHDDLLFSALTDSNVGIDEATDRPKISREILIEMCQYLSV